MTTFTDQGVKFQNNHFMFRDLSLLKTRSFSSQVLNSICEQNIITVVKMLTDNQNHVTDIDQSSCSRKVA